MSAKLLARVHTWLSHFYGREDDHPFTVKAFWDKKKTPDNKQMSMATVADPTNPLPPIFVHQRNKSEIMVTMRFTTFCWFVENFFGRKQIEDYLERQEVIDEG